MIDTNLFEDNLNKLTVATKEFENLLKGFKDKEIDNFIYNLPEKTFIRYCYLTLAPQSYGFKFQERFLRQYNLTKVKSNDENGDFTNGIYHFEYKVSIMTNKNPVVDIVQIRPDHKMSHYIVQIIDVRDLENCNICATLCLTKEQMANELLLTGSQSAHSKKGKATEFRIDFKFGSNVFNRFIDNYKLNNSIINT